VRGAGYEPEMRKLFAEPKEYAHNLKILRSPRSELDTMSFNLFLVAFLGLVDSGSHYIRDTIQNYVAHEASRGKALRPTQSHLASRTSILFITFAHS
jgi:hypothetical protein